MTTIPIPRALGTAALALAGLAIGLGAGGAVPGPPQSLAIFDWWDTQGTALASMALIRTVLVVVASYTLGVSALAVVTRITRFGWVVRLLRLVAVPTLRRHLLGATIVAASLAPGAALAQEGPSLVITDLGATDTDPGIDPIVITDLGPAEGAAPQAIISGPPALTSGADELAASSAVAPAASAGDGGDTWTVVRGDHLWGIAEETLADAGLPTGERDIVRYWTRLIDGNRAAIGADPDLIHPGLVLRLPPVDAATAGS